MSHVNNNLIVGVSRPGVALYAPVGTRRDQLTEAVRLEVRRLMLHHGDMQQIELAMRSGETKQRIQRFISGQMPYPPMDFLDRLFRVFGVTLLDGLRGAVKPVTQLPILRADVQAVADTCSTLDEPGVAAVLHLAETLRGGVRRDTRREPIGGAPKARTLNTNAKRGSRLRS